MDKTTILWADDEIDLLKPHIMFLEDKGYNVIAVTSGDEALDELSHHVVDIVFLDENMPGLTGLDTLSIIKSKHPMVPVVMITKSEEEHIMDEALGGKISDYLIKPVKPNQILLTVKKHTEGKRLADQKSIQTYQQNFRSISMELMNPLSAEGWVDIYKRLVQWDLELPKTEDRNTHEILYSQRAEANQLFCRFYEQNYEDWLSGRAEKPLMSPTVLKEKLFPLLKDDKPTFLIVIDNFRFDQWKYTQHTIETLFHTEEECVYYSILPTTT
ncbi:MAG: response regulator, partial [Bacteroidales bacterium]|nr:response regulator [Bacteroidales bacterium]